MQNLTGILLSDLAQDRSLGKRKKQVTKMTKEYDCGETSISNWSKNVTHNGCLF
jgi:hypothetical protein